MTIRPAKTPSRQAVKRLPGRVVVFLQAIGSWPVLGARMARVGFGERDHAEGMRLLAAVCAYGAPDRSALEHDESALRAQREIETWVKQHFLRFQLAIERLHAEASNPFLGIEDPAPKESVPALGKLLRRLEDLQHGPHEASDVALLRTLERRGLGATERAQLAELVRAAQAVPAAETGAPRRDPREAELLALYEWYRDWTTTAKTVVRNKRELIALGLASRGRREEAQEEEWGSSELDECRQIPDAAME